MGSDISNALLYLLISSPTSPPSMAPMGHHVNYLISILNSSVAYLMNPQT